MEERLHCSQASLLVKAGRMSGTEDSEVMEVIGFFFFWKVGGLFLNNH